jgi:hypothetical protein
MRAVLDHVVIDVQDRLGDAAAAFEQLGFQVTPPSENSLGSINRLCVFRTTYLELLAVGPRAQGEQRNRMSNPIGGNGLVFRSEDSTATVAELRERGIASGEVRAFSRPVDVEDAVEQARFETVHVQLPDALPLRSYFCRHLTPELVWRAAWMKHPNGALDIAGVTIAAHHPDTIGAWLRQAFDAIPQWIDISTDAEDARSAAIGRLRVIAPTPRSPQSAMNVTIAFDDGS